MNSDKTNAIAPIPSRGVPGRTQQLPAEYVKVHPIEPFFHPEPRRAPSPEYEEFVRVRKKILDVVRKGTPEKKRILARLWRFSRTLI